MTNPVSRLLALGLALLPSAALAHGDHHGLLGLVHVATEPEHLGMALLAIIAGAAAVRMLRRSRRRDERDGTA